MIKTNFAILCFLIFCFGTFGQEPPKNQFFFDEFQASGNLILQLRQQKKVGGGFGLKMFHTGFPTSKSQLIFGTDLNINRLYMDEIKNVYGRSTQVNISLLSIGFPVFYRFYFGELKKTFIQTGVFLNFNLAQGNADSTYFSSKIPSLPKSNTRVQMNTQPTFGAILGLGRRFDLWSRKFYFLTELEVSALPVFKNCTFSGLPYYNNYLRFGLGIVTK